MKRAAILLPLLLGSGCAGRDTPRASDSAGVAEADTIVASRGEPSESVSNQAFRAIGTEPFWSLEVTSAGLRFIIPEDTAGIRFPPRPARIAGDTLQWSGETEPTPIDARIWPGSCSDGMSDRVWPYEAVVKIGRITHRGCAERLEPPEGRWRVVAHRAPGVSALSPQEVEAWIGRTAQYFRSRARFGAKECLSASYTRRTLAAEEFVERFRVSPADLGLPAQIQMIEVRCDGAEWAAPGGLLIVKGPNELLTFWDGVFFELHRD